jgi:uncharacterized membrane protein YccF (DUF307 family)
VGAIGNIIWFIFGGFWLVLANIIFGLFCCITIIGIPIDQRCFELAGTSLVPNGKTVVTNKISVYAMKVNGEKN